MNENSDILDILPCAYLSFRDSGIITNCNKVVEDWVGLPREQVIGKSVGDIFTVATRIFYNTHFFPLIKLHSKASEIFLSLKDKDNTEIPVLANAQRVLQGDEGMVHCIFVRVEQRKKFEQELLNARRKAEAALNENRQLSELTKSLEKQALVLDRQYQKLVSVNEDLLRFSKIISHDLQEPIRKIRIFADRIVKNVDAGKGKIELFCSKIDASAERLRRLTDTLQQYVNIDADSNFISVDLNHVIGAARDKAIEARQFTDFGIEIGKMPMVDGYRSQLELMFFHLIDNSIQFRHRSRYLFIKIEALILQENVFRISSDKYKYVDCVRISFEDNGIGFPEQYKEYIFGLLSKLDSASAGIGAGLSLVQKIVDNHFGRISVASEPDTGTRFEIEFPLKMETR